MNRNLAHRRSAGIDTDAVTCREIGTGESVRIWPSGAEAGNWRNCWRWNPQGQWEGQHKPALMKTAQVCLVSCPDSQFTHDSSFIQLGLVKQAPMADFMWQWQTQWDHWTRGVTIGTPKWEIQCVTNALAQVGTIVSKKGMASGHLIKRFTIVMRWVHLLEGGRSPTRSTLIWLKRRRGTWNVASGALMCRWTLEVGKGYMLYPRY